MNPKKTRGKPADVASSNVPDMLAGAQPGTPSTFFGTVPCALRSGTVTPRQGDFQALIEHLSNSARVVQTTREQYDKLDEDQQKLVKDGPGFVLGEFKDNRRRRDATERTTALGLDVDEAGAPDIEELRALLAGTRAIIYESLRSTPAARRWRVIIEYSGTATPEQHEAAFEHWRCRIPGVGESAKDPSRLWYGVQRFSRDPERIFEVLEGSPYDPAEIAPPAARERLNGHLSPREAFLRNIKPPVDTPASEGDRNMQLARYCASLLSRRQVQDAEELLGALLAKNAEYTPPLSDREVQQIARRDWKQRATKFGWVAGGARKGFSLPEAGSQDEPVAFDGAVGFDLNDVLDAEVGETPWIVDGLLTYGAHLLVGRPKGGKSWVTMDMAYACANGGKFLGRRAQRTDVLWIAAEDTRETASRRLKVRGERASASVTLMTMESLRLERTRWDSCPFDAWLRSYLEQHPNVGLVIMDTHSTTEARWNEEDIDQKRNASIVDAAYQRSRLYESLGQEFKCCIVLVHHARKSKGKEVFDYHELINLPATVVAGATASLVLADLPDRDPLDRDNHQRVFACRGRHIIHDVVEQIELDGGRAKLLGAYFDIAQSTTQAEVLTELELLISECGWPEKEVWVTQEQLARALGKHKNTVQAALRTMRKDPLKMVWKQYRVETKPSKGVTLVSRSPRVGE